MWSITGGTKSSSPIVLTPRTKNQSHQRYALKCLFSPDSRYVWDVLHKQCHCLFFFLSLLATTSADGTCKIWSTVDFSLQNTLKRSTDKWVWDCAFSCDSQYIFTGILSE